jgi:hypothetical protein
MGFKKKNLSFVQNVSRIVPDCTRTAPHSRLQRPPTELTFYLANVLKCETKSHFNIDSSDINVKSTFQNVI